MTRGRRPKAVVVLEILLAGLPVKFPDEEHIYYYQDGILGVEATATNTSKPGWSEQRLMGVDITVPQFIKMCEKFTWDEMFIMGSGMVLRSMNEVRKGSK